jgi:O-antigen/teichoic acid export membrane protein
MGAGDAEADVSGVGSPGIPAPGAAERRVAVRGVAWAGMESAASAAVGILMTPLVVRTAGLEGLGLWGAAWSLAHMAGLVDLGAGASYSRFAARALARHDRDELEGAVAVGTALHLTLSAAIALVAIVALPRLLVRASAGSPLPEGAGTVAALTLATVLLRGALSAWRGVVAGAQRTDLLARIGVVVALGEGLLGAAALLSGLGLAGLAASSCVAAIGALAAERAAARRLCPGLRLRPFRAGRSVYREVIAYGARLQVTRAFEILAAHVPRLVLAIAPGLAAAGAYDLGARIAGLTSAAASLPLRVVLPIAGHLEARGDRDRLRTLQRRVTRGIALVATLPVVVVLLDAGAVLTAWTGDVVPAQAAACARLLAVASLVGLVAAPLRLAIRGIGHAGLETIATGAGSVVLVAGGIALAGRGAGGVAAAALAGALVSSCCLAAGIALARSGGLGFGDTLAAAFPALVAGTLSLGAGALATALFPAGDPVDRAQALARLAISLPCASLVYLAAARVTGALRLSDLALVRDATAPLSGPAAGGADA